MDDGTAENTRQRTLHHPPFCGHPRLLRLGTCHVALRPSQYIVRLFHSSIKLGPVNGYIVEGSVLCSFSLAARLSRPRAPARIRPRQAWLAAELPLPTHSVSPRSNGGASSKLGRRDTWSPKNLVNFQNAPGSENPEKQNRRSLLLIATGATAGVREGGHIQVS